MKLFTYDLETTDKDPKKARIVQVAYVLMDFQSREVLKKSTQLVNPGVPIPLEAYKVHGIGASDVEGKPSFKDVAEKLLPVIKEADIISGYNSYAYDDLVLAEEFNRIGSEIDLSDKIIMDVFKMVRFYFGMNIKLSGLHRMLVASDFEDAHDALADVEATNRCLFNILPFIDTYRKNKGLVPYQEDPSQTEDMFINELDRGGLLQWNEDNDIIFTFGKCRNELLKEVVDTDRGYLEWMYKQEFPEDFKKIISRALVGKIPQYTVEEQ